MNHTSLHEISFERADSGVFIGTRCLATLNALFSQLAHEIGVSFRAHPGALPLNELKASLLFFTNLVDMNVSFSCQIVQIEERIETHKLGKT